jgi:hypothetical protein
MLLDMSQFETIADWNALIDPAHKIQAGKVLLSARKVVRTIRCNRQASFEQRAAVRKNPELGATSRVPACVTTERFDIAS